jgi:hypothetical protein
MQVSTHHYLDDIAVAQPDVVALDDEPSRYWILSLITASTATWLAIFGTAKLLFAVL